MPVSRGIHRKYSRRDWVFLLYSPPCGLGLRVPGTPYLTLDARLWPGCGVPEFREFRGHHTWEFRGHHTRKNEYGSSGDTIPNSEKMSMVSPELVFQDEWKPRATPTFHHPSPGDWRRSSSWANDGSLTPKASVIPVENPPEIPQGIVSSYRIQDWFRVLSYGKKKAQESLASKDRD